MTLGGARSLILRQGVGPGEPQGVTANQQPEQGTFLKTHS